MAHFGALWRKQEVQQPGERKSFGAREMRVNYGQNEWRAQHELNLQPLVP